MTYKITPDILLALSRFLDGRGEKHGNITFSGDKAYAFNYGSCGVVLDLAPIEWDEEEDCPESLYYPASYSEIEELDPRPSLGALAMGEIGSDLLTREMFEQRNKACQNPAIFAEYIDQMVAKYKASATISLYSYQLKEILDEHKGLQVAALGQKRSHKFVTDQLSKIWELMEACGQNKLSLRPPKRPNGPYLFRFDGCVVLVAAIVESASKESEDKPLETAV